MNTPVTRKTLDNGLLIVLKEIHSAPIISHWVWYRVGSRDEGSGMTGASHWVEHMQFKGTPQFPANVLDKAIAREGGFWNAFTHLDWTTYFETLPSDKIDLALRLEADRMVDSLFDPAELEAERTVVMAERQGSENHPLFRLQEQVQQAAFQRHSYQHSIIGTMADLEQMSRDDLYAHYKRHYTPDNAVVAAAGDFKTEEMLARLEALYERIPAGNPPSRRTITPEPQQQEEQQVTVEGPGETGYVQIAYHAPAATNPDFFPFMALDSLLTGPSSINMFGGGLSNKTTRLYEALVENDLAANISGGMFATIDPFLLPITMVLLPEGRGEAAIAALDDEIKRLQDQAPGAGEMKRAIKQARALFAYGSESTTNQGFWLGLAEMVDTQEWFSNYLDNLAAVTPEDVQRAAQNYLRPEQRVVGVYIPTDQAPAGQE